MKSLHKSQCVVQTVVFGNYELYVSKYCGVHRSVTANLVVRSDGVNDVCSICW